MLSPSNEAIDAAGNCRNLLQLAPQNLVFPSQAFLVGAQPQTEVRLGLVHDFSTGGDVERKCAAVHSEHTKP
jgi:hypothetical protein